MIGGRSASCLVYGVLCFLPTLLAPQQLVAAQGSDTFTVLVSEADMSKKICPTKDACPSMEVDKEGKQVVREQEDKGKGKKHWYCGSEPNGQGGYQCTQFYLGRSNCNSHPTWSCQNVGSGASENCICK